MCDNSLDSLISSHFQEWQQWPQGEWPHLINSFTLECPICTTKLLPVRLEAPSHRGVFDLYHEPSLVEDFTLICPRCRSRYLKTIPAGTVKVINPDENAEKIAQLEQRIAQLEATVRKLIAIIQEKPRHQPQPVSQEMHAPDDDEAAEFVAKYHYLL